MLLFVRPLLALVLFERFRFRLLVVALSFIATLFGLGSPYLQRLFLEQLTASSGSLPMALLIGAAVSLFFGHLFNLFAVYMAAREAVNLQRELTERMYRHTLNQQTAVLGPRPSGEIVSLFATDAQGAGILLEQCLPQLAGIVFPLVLAPLMIVLLYRIPLQSTLMVFTLIVLINTALASRQSRFFYRFKTLAADRTALVTEWVQNMRALRILGWVPEFEERIFNKRREETANRIRMVTNGQFLNSIATTATFVVNLSALSALVLARGTEVSSGELLSLFWIFGVFLTRSFRQLPWLLIMGLDGLSSLKRVEAYLARPVVEDPLQFEPPQLEASLEVENLNLVIGEQKILDNISFHIQAGEFVAIVGEVGSGKSSLLLSLLGETACTFSSYRIGQRSTLSLSSAQLRSQFCYVPQEGFVMSSTLRDNIAFDYDIPPAQDPKLRKVLQAAQFHLESETLPGGLDTEIGERGINLSGGQRQRISLARAAHFNRPILLLDDCLSAVDVETERNLVEELFLGHWAHATRILVTHRLSILSRVDRVIYIKDGRLLDAAPYQELLERCDEFRSFAALPRQESLS